MPWISVVVSLMSACLLLTAAKDASKIKPAWFILLIDVILSVAELFFSLDKGSMVMISAVIALVLNLVAFIAANNVKKQANL